MIVIDDATAQLYRDHALELVRFATGLVGPSDAADVVSDAMARLVTSRIWKEAIDHRALMFRAVVFEAKMFHRSRRRRRLRETATLERDSYEIPTAQPEIWAAVSRLSPQQRAVTYLTYWNDLDAASVAALLGVGEGTVRKQLGRARGKLKEELS